MNHQAAGRGLRPYVITAVAIILVGSAVGYALSPAGQLRYHGWRYRSGRDADRSSLKLLAAWAVEQKASRAAMADRMGQPEISMPDRVLYCPRPTSSATPDDVVYLILLDRRGCAEKLEAEPARNQR